MIPKDIRKIASDYADTRHFAGWERDQIRDEVAALLTYERQRCLNIIDAEREWGGDVEAIEDRIKAGDGPRIIHGYNDEAGS